MTEEKNEVIFDDDKISKSEEFVNPDELYQELIQCVQKYHPSDDISMIEKAYKVASEAHKNQFRKSGEPYIIHPLNVAIILADLKLDKETIVAGILHDVVEDTVMTEEDLRREFGDDVALLVDGVTKLEKIPLSGSNGEQSQIFPLVHAVQQPGHVMDEAHVQHPVRLVQHHGFCRIHPDGAALHVVGQPSRCGHYDLGMFFQRVDLAADGCAAVQAHCPDAGFIGVEDPQLIGDLDGKLPGGGQDHRLNALVLRVDMLHNGDAVGKGLAGAGGGLGDDVAPGQHDGDGLFLHLGHFRKAHPLYGLMDGLAAL